MSNWNPRMCRLTGWFILEAVCPLSPVPCGMNTPLAALPRRGRLGRLSGSVWPVSWDHGLSPSSVDMLEVELLGRGGHTWSTSPDDTRLCQMSCTGWHPLHGGLGPACSHPHHHLAVLGEGPVLLKVLGVPGAGSALGSPVHPDTAPWETGQGAPGPSGERASEGLSGR